MPSIAPRVRPRLLACAAVLLSLSAPALAQRVVEGDLQQQMSPSEFKAAGLDKLSAGELATLNRWLQGKVEAATNQAVAAAREEGRQGPPRHGHVDLAARNRLEDTRGRIRLAVVAVHGVTDNVRDDVSPGERVRGRRVRVVVTDELHADTQPAQRRIVE